MDKQDQQENGGCDLTQTRQSILEDTNVNPMISECLNNIFRVVNPDVKKSIKLNQDETGNL